MTNLLTIEEFKSELALLPEPQKILRIRQAISERLSEYQGIAQSMNKLLDKAITEGPEALDTATDCILKYLSEI